MHSNAFFFFLEEKDIKGLLQDTIRGQSNLGFFTFRAFVHPLPLSLFLSPSLPYWYAFTVRSRKPKIWC